MGRDADPHPVVVGGVRVLIAGDDLWGHPVRRPDEGVPPAHRPIQLSADAKVHCPPHEKDSVSGGKLTLAHILNKVSYLV